MTLGHTNTSSNKQAPFVNHGHEVVLHIYVVTITKTPESSQSTTNVIKFLQDLLSHVESAGGQLLPRLTFYNDLKYPFTVFPR